MLITDVPGIDSLLEGLKQSQESIFDQYSLQRSRHPEVEDEARKGFNYQGGGLLSYYMQDHGKDIPLDGEDEGVHTPFDICKFIGEQLSAITNKKYLGVIGEANLLSYHLKSKQNENIRLQEGDMTIESCDSDLLVRLFPQENIGNLKPPQFRLYFLQNQESLQEQLPQDLPYLKKQLTLQNQMKVATDFYKAVPSTMTFAEKLIIKDLPSNQAYVFIADQQTQGYGVASGSKWVSPLGNLYFTICMSAKKESVLKNALHSPKPQIPKD